MKKLITGLLVGMLLTAGTYTFVSALACTPLGSTTANLGFCNPATGETSWGTYVNANWTALDAMFPSSILGIANGGTGTTTGALTKLVFVLNGLNNSNPQSFCAVSGTIMDNGGTVNLGCTVDEENVAMVMPYACTAKNLYVRTGASNAAATTVTLRKNKASTALTIASSAAGSTTTSDTSHTVSVAAGDRLNLTFSTTVTTNFAGISMECDG